MTSVCCRAKSAPVWHTNVSVVTLIAVCVSGCIGLFRCSLQFPWNILHHIKQWKADNEMVTVITPQCRYNYCIDNSPCFSGSAIIYFLLINNTWLDWAVVYCALGSVELHTLHVLFMINGKFTFSCPLTFKKWGGKNKTLSILFTLIQYRYPGEAPANRLGTTQLKMERKCKCKCQKNRHIASLIISESWLILIKNSITLTMVSSYKTNLWYWGFLNYKTQQTRVSITSTTYLTLSEDKTWFY